VYRAVRSLPLAEQDFDSQRRENPDRVFSGIPECLVRGVSVFAKREDCERLLKLPRMRNRHVCRVQLESGGG
jgi:hypothetical protein